MVKGRAQEALDSVGEADEDADRGDFRDVARHDLADVVHPRRERVLLERSKSVSLNSGVAGILACRCPERLG